MKKISFLAIDFYFSMLLNAQVNPKSPKRGYSVLKIIKNEKTSITDLILLFNSYSEWAKKDLAILEEDNTAYPKIYEAKKAKIKYLLASKKPEWLQKPAVVDNNNKTSDANKRLENLGTFYDAEDEYASALYVLNPEYFKPGNRQSPTPVFMAVQFRYELGKDRGFSGRLLNNFQNNFDMQALKKMIQ